MTHSQGHNSVGLSVVLRVFMEKGQTANESLYDFDDVMLTFPLDVYVIFIIIVNIRN